MAKSNGTAPPPSREELLEHLRKDDQDKRNACMDEIQAVLSKYGFDLVAQPMVVLVPHQ